eukprot:TRINITY_DN1888_c0_g1_i1.p2 TRINITY_DN1888_c0_g1~~TRINITY_DN1888_c0_g1_i1.p2  ORF type:complete len:111 (-),score=23.74 TRINITY_DN1888_c0_g1_i1:266-598(-)
MKRKNEVIEPENQKSAKKSRKSSEISPLVVVEDILRSSLSLVPLESSSERELLAHVSTQIIEKVTDLQLPNGIIPDLLDLAQENEELERRIEMMKTELSRLEGEKDEQQK